ncbi:MvaI/BcnI family restriction endonuclease [Shewanella frigidimarina]|uniref:MvaI/BcnI family restriction endonuclease n=4 Tax=Shewanellaceae TaxID=267890 RepID=UPI000CB618FE|nr:MvaI/BcnI family restriction endonuclease [Shewanella frigidimarina]NCP92494.1 hypothetical protein [Shewanella vesiculosa]PJB93065.1 MAG: hypothetical protein CO084_04960 [Shewanella sp. CG_4_9_14_0_8_um_filter_42_14]RPA30432.1 hypothetical protein EGC78_14970 [Shewanella frigidimarina]
MMTSFKAISGQMRKLGASRIFFKSLANNDNTKQQIYLGSEFDVIRSIPSGEIYADGISKKGPIFKAPLDFYWMDEGGNVDRAPKSQIILYPKYPEIRMSGFLSGTNRKLDITPRHLMQPPTLEERAERIGIHRYLVLGVNKTTTWAYCTSWEDELALELKQLVTENKANLVASVFYESMAVGKTSEEKLLDKLRAIYEDGPIESCRLQADGTKIPYKAQNGGGYTLEAQFNITPNGFADPDFMDWELKAHSGSVVTLMTPEPNTGIYIQDGLKTFLDFYATRKQKERLDFASRHDVNKANLKTNLTMYLEGYDSRLGKITDPDGGLMLRDQFGKLAAGWSFDKVIEHWKRKHSNTCYVTYTANKNNTLPRYLYGPKVTLGQGTSLEHFLKALHSCAIYYDPGINMKLEGDKWKPKKRSQFRVKWKDINQLYHSLRVLDLSKA